MSLVRDPNENAEKSDHNVTAVPLKTSHANIRLHDPAPLFPSENYDATSGFCHESVTADYAALLWSPSMLFQSFSRTRPAAVFRQHRLAADKTAIYTVETSQLQLIHVIRDLNVRGQHIICIRIFSQAAAYAALRQRSSRVIFRRHSAPPRSITHLPETTTNFRCANYTCIIPFTDGSE